MRTGSGHEGVPMLDDARSVKIILLGAVLAITIPMVVAIPLKTFYVPTLVEESGRETEISSPASQEQTPSYEERTREGELSGDEESQNGVRRLLIDAFAKRLEALQGPRESVQESPQEDFPLSPALPFFICLSIWALLWFFSDRGVDPPAGSTNLLRSVQIVWKAAGPLDFVRSPGAVWRIAGMIARMERFLSDYTLEDYARDFSWMQEHPELEQGEIPRKLIDRLIDTALGEWDENRCQMAAFCILTTLEELSDEQRRRAQKINWVTWHMRNGSEEVFRAVRTCLPRFALPPWLRDEDGTRFVSREPFWFSPNGTPVFNFWVEWHLIDYEYGYPELEGRCHGESFLLSARGVCVLLVPDVSLPGEGYAMPVPPECRTVHEALAWVVYHNPERFTGYTHEV